MYEDGLMDVEEIIIFAQQLYFATARFRRLTTTLLQIYNYIYTPKRIYIINIIIIIVSVCSLLQYILLYTPCTYYRGRAAHHSN